MPVVASRVGMPAMSASGTENAVGRSSPRPCEIALPCMSALCQIGGPILVQCSYEGRFLDGDSIKNKRSFRPHAGGVSLGYPVNPTRRPPCRSPTTGSGRTRRRTCRASPNSAVLRGRFRHSRRRAAGIRAFLLTTIGAGEAEGAVRTVFRMAVSSATGLSRSLTSAPSRAIRSRAPVRRCRWRSPSLWRRGRSRSPDRPSPGPDASPGGPRARPPTATDRHGACP